ncbi:MAG: sulfite exporter TauE/SafE family protein [Myxococcota bacterium]|nr:sulfite exporter TauE/SafE family protein [Myxococcota bacterium]
MAGFEGFGPLGSEAAIVLAVAAFATAGLSAIVGMAGGITLLAVMLLYAEPLLVIPLHGVIQLISNGSRSWIQRRSVRRDIVWRYALLLLPAGFAGIGLAQRLPPDGLRAVIGAFVLLATWAPGALLLGTHPENTNAHRRFVVLGGAVGFLNVSIGATGPLIAPFFLNLGLDRFALIGTKAACQTLGHLAKLVVFGAVGFAFGEHALLLALLAAMVVAGTWTGSRLLEFVNERAFTLLYKSVLTLIALRLVASALS